MPGNEKIPEISGWTKTSFIDYPGRPAMLLFLSGCNLRCPYCHNPGIVLGQYESISLEAVKERVIKRKGVIEGVVVSGGEPTLHSGLAGLCGELRSLGLMVKIDTNGLEPDVLTGCRPDYLAVDVKAIPEKYRLLGWRHGDCRERLSKSINIARAMGENAEIRITAVPGIVGRGDMEPLIPMLCGVSKVFIQQFNPTQPMLDPSCSSVKPYGADELEAMRDVLLGAGIDCAVR
jgi:pyruvate formate lyase activating enzyme